MVDIAYLVPGSGFTEDERARRERVANDLTSATVTVVNADPDGPSSIESTVDDALSVPGTLRRARAIEAEYDAIVVGCFGDTGLRPLRELVSVPVVGPAEATVHTAAQVADRFGWLTVLDRTIPMCREQLHALGFTERCAGVRSVDAPVEDIDHESTALAERMVATGSRAVREDGADALFPGCMSLSFAQQHEFVAERLDVPFLDPATIALEQAATWARHGITQSDRSYPPVEACDHDELR
ncbi:aspartate/glutamate racemase family protein [Salarchaeum sp. III]|uniref:aspartate/glutamate racemase family protein n=1 Tax=Salarchaeum sp. III TaxID=3107927 RepID=UPI002ED9A330